MYGEDWMKNVVFRHEILKMAQNTEVRLPRMRAKYFRFLSQTNSALKITSAIHVPNLVKIGEKLCPLALTKWQISLLRKSVVVHGQRIHPFWL